MLPHSPSPLAGEGLGRGGKAASAAHKTLTEILSRKATLLERARYMRANPTDAERALWRILRAKQLNSLKWQRQVIIDDRYIVDFICFEHRLVVEADGSQHADNKADTQRDAYLNAQGFHVLRFWNMEILTAIESVATAIFAAVESFCAQTRAAPSPACRVACPRQPTKLSSSPVKGESVKKAMT
jgi:very-short-patch-repair endonuclease